ncbi:MAG: hypothetical protein Q8L64_04315 [bacterium]|nr:hypothetical protein [bacterium]
MRTITALILSVFLITPINVIADESASSTEPIETLSPPSISVTVNLRHKSSLVWEGPVSIHSGVTTQVLDNSGNLRDIPSNSALAALAAADSASAEFTLSGLRYYADFGSLFVDCISIAAISGNACGNWQYVVGSTYPPIGSDKYVLSNGDTVYFYFGSPRKVTLAQSNINASNTVEALAESYDHMNGVWKPLSGADIGVTQPNPDDPYSPLVRFSGKSGSDGIARIAVTVPGTYSVGIASDYYYPAEILVVTEPAPAQTPTNGSSSSGSSGSSHGNRQTPTAVNSTTNEQTGVLTTPTPVTQTTTELIVDDPLIILDIPIEEFIRRYLAFTSFQGLNHEHSN